MFHPTVISRKLPALAWATIALAGIGQSVVSYADDAPPPASQPDAAPGMRHHNPAWAACKQQADDKHLQPGEARHEFMKSCLKSARDAATPPPASP
jgi:hypothetical protein